MKYRYSHERTPKTEKKKKKNSILRKLEFYKNKKGKVEHEEKPVEKMPIIFKVPEGEEGRKMLEEAAERVGLTIGSKGELRWKGEDIIIERGRRINPNFKIKEIPEEKYYEFKRELKKLILEETPETIEEAHVKTWFEKLKGGDFWKKRRETETIPKEEFKEFERNLLGTPLNFYTDYPEEAEKYEKEVNEKRTTKKKMLEDIFTFEKIRKEKADERKTEELMKEKGYNLNKLKDSKQQLKLYMDLIHEKGLTEEEAGKQLQKIRERIKKQK